MLRREPDWTTSKRCRTGKWQTLRPPGQLPSVCKKTQTRLQFPVIVQTKKQGGVLCIFSLHASTRIYSCERRGKTFLMPKEEYAPLPSKTCSLLHCIQRARNKSPIKCGMNNMFWRYGSTEPCTRMFQAVRISSFQLHSDEYVSGRFRVRYKVEESA